MKMENAFDNILRKKMSLHASAVEHPDPLLVFEARQVVLSRMKRAKLSSFRDVLSRIIGMALRPAHVGLCGLLLAGGIISWNGLGSGNGESVSEPSAQSALTFSQATVCVISNTMLTSIPTLRN